MKPHDPPANPAEDSDLADWENAPFPPLPEGEIPLGQVEASDSDTHRPLGKPLSPGPRRIDKYVIERTLGAGAFGTVYLCHDPDVERKVAVKVIDESKLPGHSPAEYRAEAQALGKLDHPWIVPVYAADRSSDGRFYVVSKYLAGGDLKTHLKSEAWSVAACVRAAADIADALDHAHQRQIIHRDVKPANILLDLKRQVYLSDFGIALHDARPEKHSALVGTVPYMSPEQACGEGHRLDGRSDLFSLGAVLYEMLFGKRLFPGNSRREIISSIASFDPDALGEYGVLLPVELDCILRRALARRAADRFVTAGEFARALRNWLQNQVADPTSAESVDKPIDAKSAKAAGISTATSLHPRGLKPFGASDSKVYLDLLPGPRDEEGLPDIVSFWLKRLDPARQLPDAEPLAVGVVYGPSGSGKSSLLAAGILPRLSREVRVAWVECTPNDTPVRILRTLARIEESTIDETPTSGGSELPESFARIRRTGLRTQKRCLLVLDQFEQWLRGWNGSRDDPMVLALRQCDGKKLQAVLSVRDDFWSTISKLLQELEIPLSENSTATNVSGFSPRHARRVLRRFGKAYHDFESDGTEEMEIGASAPTDASKFINAVVEQLAGEGSVLPVRIALFVEAVKDLPWTPATLKRIGGVEGAARHFLESAFGPGAPAGQRRRRAAAMRVLELLLPEDANVDLKAAQRSVESLTAAAGYSDSPTDARELFDLLENRLRLISAVEAPPALFDSASDATQSLAQYQLTHDYLVRPLRGWIAADRSRSVRGRLEQRIDQLAKAYATAPEARNLPEWWIWPGLATAYWTSGPDFRTPARQALISAANRRYGLAAAGAFAALIAFVFMQREWGLQHRAEALAESLTTSRPEAAPGIIREIPSLGNRVQNRLKSMLAELPAQELTAEARRQALRAQLGLLSSEPERFANVVDLIVGVPPEEIAAAIAAIPSTTEVNTKLIESAIDRAGADVDAKLRLGCLLAAFDANSQAWSDLAPLLASAICAMPEVDARRWIELLTPANRHLTTPIEKIAAESREEDRGATAALFLARCLHGRETEIHRLIESASARQLRSYLDGAAETLGASAARYQDISRTAKFVEQPISRAKTGERRANAAIALLRIGDFSGFEALARDIVDPNGRTKFVRRYSEAGLDPATLLAALDRTDLSVDGKFMAMLTLMRMLPLMKPKIKEELVKRLQPVYAAEESSALSDDPGVHSVAGWLLERLGRRDFVAEWDLKHFEQGIRGQRRWFVAPNGHLMAIFGPQQIELREFEPNVAVFLPRKIRVDHHFAMAVKETTVAQFLRLDPEPFQDDSVRQLPEEPARNIRFALAVGYPELLSEKAGIPPELRIAPRYAELRPALRSIFEARDAKSPLEVSGYRFPTPDEWEIACRSGAATLYSFGDDEADANEYAVNSRAFGGGPGLAGSLLPNRNGLFDMHGNLQEYTSRLPWDQQRPGAPVKIMFRGGSFILYPASQTAKSRYEIHMDCGAPLVRQVSGVRIAVTIDPFIKRS